MTDSPYQLVSKTESNRKRLLRLALQKKGLSPKRKTGQIESTGRTKNQELPLSSAQQRLWFLEQFNSETTAYVFCNKVDLQGHIELKFLVRAFRTIVDRHEIFRTSYRQRDGVAYQFVDEAMQFEVPIVDLTDLSEDDRRREYDRVVEAESHQVFDLESAPLMRIVILKLRPDHHIVLQTVHHIVYDGWSLAVMYRELKALYEAYTSGNSVPLAPLDIQYADYANWQIKRLDSPELKRQLEFWTQQLDGDLPKLELPSEKPRPMVQSYSGSLCKLRFDEAFSESLRLLAVQYDCTLSMVMLTAFKILLSRYTGEEDILVGMPVANRNHPQIEKLIGFFVNSLVIRTSLEYDPSVEELFKRVRKASSQAYQSQDVPFDRIVDEIQPVRDIGHNPIFQVMFAFQNTPSLPQKIGDAKFELEVLDNDTSVFDLTLNLHDEGGEIYGYFEYCTDIFDAETIENMNGHYKTILESIVSSPESKISSLQILTPPEQHRLLLEWNSTHVDYDADRCVHHLIETQAISDAASIAIKSSDQQLDYGQLNRRANRLARKLQSCGVAPDTIVAVFMDRSCDMFISILAILKAGGAYLPLDPSYPSSRISFMLEDSGASILLTHELALELLPENSLELICLDRDRDQWSNNDSGNPESRVMPENLAYIIYTSGSTGMPKGVMVRHRNLVHSTLARMSYYQQPLESYLLLSSFAFDSSVAGIFWTLCQGGTLCLPRQAVEKDLMQIADLVEAFEITHMLSLPSVYSLLLTVASQRQLATLNTVIVAGETCPVELSEQHKAVLPDTALYNEYGPTEGTVWSTAYCLSSGEMNNQVPIGKPISNVETYILDPHMKPVPIGVIGELYIGGAGIVRGYLNRNQLTAERFIQSPFCDHKQNLLYRTGDLSRYRKDGNIIFCGRTDHQVKIRGYRIELGEIESTILSRESIADAVVIAHEASPGAETIVRTKKLVAYLVAASLPNPDLDDLKLHLKSRLPDYMVPQAYVFMDKIPLSPNGKVDLKALPAFERDVSGAGVSYTEAESEGEQILTRIWSSVLGINKIGVHDNFFEIGGDSILSIQIIARAKESGLHINPKQVFQNPTIFELAKVATSSKKVLAEQGVVVGEIALTPVQQWFFECGLPNPNHWNQPVMLRPGKRLDPVILQQAFGQLAIQHDMFRARFECSGNVWRQHVTEDFNMDEIQVYDLSTMNQEERPRSLSRLAGRIQSSLDIQAGKLVAAGYFQMGEQESGDRLLVAVHHLVIDTVSWVPVIEDLGKIYHQLEAQIPVKLADKSTSFKRWSKVLSKYASSRLLKSELEYWLSLPVKGVFDIPVDMQSGENIEASESTVSIMLNLEETRNLLTVIPPVYNTRIDEVLLTALALVVSQWTGHEEQTICMEGHGREYIDDEIDLSRTIGWFTSHFPVRLKLDTVDPGAAIKCIKEQIRSIPNRGIGYGVLRYYEADEEVRERLTAVHGGNILYNNLGQIKSQDDEENLFSFSDEPCGMDHDRLGRRTHWLEINAMVVNDQLRIDWKFSLNIHYPETIQNLANNYLQALRGLINHCLSPEAGGISASDFPQAELDQNELDDLLGLLED